MYLRNTRYIYHNVRIIFSKDFEENENGHKCRLCTLYEEERKCRSTKMAQKMCLVPNEQRIG